MHFAGVMFVSTHLLSKRSFSITSFLSFSTIPHHAPSSQTATSLPYTIFFGGKYLILVFATPLLQFIGANPAILLHFSLLANRNLRCSQNQKIIIIHFMARLSKLWCGLEHAFKNTQRNNECVSMDPNIVIGFNNRINTTRK